MESYFIRLRKARVLSGQKKSRIASVIGVKPSEYEAIENGTVRPSLRTRRLIESFAAREGV